MHSSVNNEHNSVQEHAGTFRSSCHWKTKSTYQPQLTYILQIPQTLAVWIILCGLQLSFWWLPVRQSNVNIQTTQIPFVYLNYEPPCTGTHVRFLYACTQSISQSSDRRLQVFYLPKNAFKGNYEKLSYADSLRDQEATEGLKGWRWLKVTAHSSFYLTAILLSHFNSHSWLKNPLPCSSHLLWFVF